MASSQSVATEIEAPKETRITSVFPNPVASVTTVAFELATPSPVALRVIDALGRVVHTEAMGDLPPGTHTLRWDASGMAAGVYVVELAVDGTRLVRSVAVQR